MRASSEVVVVQWVHHSIEGLWVGVVVIVHQERFVIWDSIATVKAMEHYGTVHSGVSERKRDSRMQMYKCIKNWSTVDRQRMKGSEASDPQTGNVCNSNSWAHGEGVIL